MANIELEPITLELDPEWRMCRRYACGHVQHACCDFHLDDVCPVCQPGLAMIENRVKRRAAGVPLLESDDGDLVMRKTLGDSL